MLKKYAQSLGLVAVLLVLSIFGLNLTNTPIDDQIEQLLVLGRSTDLESNEAIVESVVDGDTIKLTTGETVRYIGIDTPETKHPQKGQECFGQEASRQNAELVEGQVVRLEKDVSETDRYGRLLRYVWVDEIMINEQLVRDGYAVASSYPPDVAYQDIFREAQEQAIADNVGLWAECED